MSEEQIDIITRPQLAAAFNEWMTRYTESPELFAREWETVHEFLEAQNAGIEPSYGESAASYLLSLLGVAQDIPLQDTNHGTE